MGAEGTVVELNGEMVEQILEAIHENGAKLDDALKRIKNIEGTIDVVINSQAAQGTELEDLKRNCNKRATACTAAFRQIRNELSGNGGDGD